MSENLKNAMWIIVSYHMSGRKLRTISVSIELTKGVSPGIIARPLHTIQSDGFSMEHLIPLPSCKDGRKVIESLGNHSGLMGTVCSLCYVCNCVR